jgi:acetylornithine deacetylase/succinyl-diaminopimelate desuccinylase-like protein
MKRCGILVCVLIVIFLTVGLSAQIPSVDWTKERAEILQQYRSLIQIDSSDPPGNETNVVDYLKKVFDAEGIPTKTFALDASRANLVARIKGNGKKRPILLMAHTDVVPVQREKWSVDPFGAVLKDGYVWGRGTSDDKDKLAANLTVMLLAKRSGIVLDRDLIFLAEADEEVAATNGIEFMVDKHYDEIDAEFALTEGGGASLQDGRVTSVAISTTEKLPRRIRLVVNGPSGHASVPRVENAVVHLTAAVTKLGQWQTPMRLNDTTRMYFSRLAEISPPDKAARYRAVIGKDAKAATTAQQYLAINEPGLYSTLRTSVVPTILKAGFKVNVIPSEAEALIDIRAVPDEDMSEFYDSIRRIIDDPVVKVEPVTEGTRPVNAPSRMDSDMYRALERVAGRMYPGSVTMPTMLTGATDMAFLRAKGMQCYGIGPAATTDDRTNFGAHSDVERLLESSLYSFVEYTWNVVMDVATSR